MNHLTIQILSVFCLVVGGLAAARAADDSSSSRSCLIANLLQQVQEGAAADQLLGLPPGTWINRKSQGKYEALDDDGRRIGTLDVRDRGKGRLEVDFLMIDQSFRGQNLARALFRAVLRDRPDVQVIRTKLAIENRRVVEEALKRGMGLESALKESPAYKIRAGEGFSEIIPGSIDSQDLSFSVRRPLSSPNR